MTTRHVRTAATLAALALTLCACSGGGEPEGTATAETGRPEGTASDSDATDASTTDGCLIGEWVDDVEWAAERRKEVYTELEYDVQGLTVAGEFGLAFTEEQVSITYADRIVDFTYTSAEPKERRWVNTYDGSLTGSYQTADGVLTMTGVVDDGLTSGMEIYADGQLEEDREGGGGTLVLGFRGAQYGYTCDDDTLTLEKVEALGPGEPEIIALDEILLHRTS